MISTPSIQQFMLRKQRHKKMIQQNNYPQSTQNEFIVPCYERSLGFKSNQYAKYNEKLEEYIDRVTFQGFVRAGMDIDIDLANRVIDGELIQKSKMENSCFFQMTSIFLKLSIVLGILTFTILSLIVYLDFEPVQEQTILTVSIVLIIVSVVIASICPFYLYLCKYVQYNYQARVKEELDKLADKENQKNKAEGRQYLKWVFGEGFFWAKLEINMQVFRDKARNKGYLNKFGQAIQSY